MKHLFLSLGLVAASVATARADVWTTTEPNGTENRTVVGRPEEPARDYSRENSRTFQPSQTHTVTRGAQIPDNVNRMREPRHRDNKSNLTVGRWVPYYYPYPYGYYPQPVYPAPIYTYPPTYTPLTPGAGIVTGGGIVPGYPYGYYPQPVYPGGGYYPYAQTPAWQFYDYSGPATGGVGGSFSTQSNSSYGGLSIGRGGVRANIGGGRTTTSGSFSTFP